MILTAEGGTDGAMMLLFWPDQLPDDADQIIQTDPMSLISEMEKQGRIIQFPCDSDGGYTVTVYVHEPVPAELASYCREEENYPALTARGPAYFGGGEYIFRKDDSFLRKFPHMAKLLRIPDGTYAASVYQTNVPQTVYAKWLLDCVGRRALRLHRLENALLAGGFMSLAGLLVSVCFLNWRVSLGLAGAMVVLLGLGVALGMTRESRNVTSARQQFKQSFPSYVVHLR